MKKFFALLSLGVFVFTAGVASAADGEALYKQSCASCHGVDGLKAAGGSPVLKGQSSQDIVTKMQGYAAGTYGGKMKGVMVNIAQKHSADETQAIADYIGKM